LSSYPFTYSSGSYNYNSIKICKQISTPPQPYQKIPDIYFLCSCSLPYFISILSPITTQFVVDVFVLYCMFLYFPLYCLIVLFDLTTTKLNKLYYSNPLHNQLPSRYTKPVNSNFSLKIGCHGNDSRLQSNT